MNPYSARARGIATVFVLVAAASLSGCSGDPTSTTGSGATTLPSATTVDPGPGFTIPPPPTIAEPWSVDTSGCINPAAANAEITDTLTIGTAAPQSGGLISVIYAPVLAGLQAYIDEANAQKLLGPVELTLVIADDEGKPEFTPVAVGGLLDAEADLVTALPGSANNLAVRESLNENCVPQLMSLASTPRLGEVRRYPWTLGGVVTETVETAVYANAIVRSIGEEATVALLVSGDEAGMTYATAFAEAALGTGLAIVDQQVVEPDVIDAPAAQVGAMAARRPQVIVASLAGAACATFLTALDLVRATVPGWVPDVYLSNDCADSSILRLAGPAAQGVMSAVNLVAGEPFVEMMAERGLAYGYSRAALGWTAAEVTVGILIRAQQSEAGLTRASIINAARNLSYEPSLAIPGVEYTTNGFLDGYLAESLQVVRYDATDQTFSDVGALVAQFES